MTPTALIGGLGLAFIAQHFTMSHPPVRRVLVDTLGLGPFRGVYSVATLAIYLPWVWLWWTHRHGGGFLWILPWPLFPGLPDLLNALGVALTVAALASPAPTSIATGVTGEIEVRGVLAITRMPGLLGLGLLSLGHVLGNGFVNDVLFFGANAVVGIAGAFHQDWRYQSEGGPYVAFAENTSIVPSVSRLGQVGRSGWAAIVAGVALAALLRWSHRFF